ncbi:MAG TPA: hypothetical protein VLN49_21535 [Gemmatimonadaceae bacterium]|nr:hypothetical protein [Gemmatimonadaceae bacterium]
MNEIVTIGPEAVPDRRRTVRVDPAVREPEREMDDGIDVVAGLAQDVLRRDFNGLELDFDAALQRQTSLWLGGKTTQAASLALAWD